MNNRMYLDQKDMMVNIDKEDIPDVSKLTLSDDKPRIINTVYDIELPFGCPWFDGMSREGDKVLEEHHIRVHKDFEVSTELKFIVNEMQKCKDNNLFHDHCNDLTLHQLYKKYYLYKDRDHLVLNSVAISNLFEVYEDLLKRLHHRNDRRFVKPGKMKQFFTFAIRPYNIGEDPEIIHPKIDKYTIDSIFLKNNSNEIDLTLYDYDNAQSLNVDFNSVPVEEVSRIIKKFMNFLKCFYGTSENDILMVTRYLGRKVFNNKYNI